MLENRRIAGLTPSAPKTISPIPGGNGSTTAFESTMKYDFGTGLPVSSVDINGHTTTIAYNDPLNRPTLVMAPNGHQTITEYGAGTTAETRFVHEIGVEIGVRPA